MKPTLTILTALLLAPLAALPAAVAETPRARPNIISLLTDDQRDSTLGAMGHPFVKTPHLNALMRDSVRFKNAYIATPVCSPSCISFFTGMPECKRRLKSAATSLTMKHVSQYLRLERDP